MTEVEVWQASLDLSPEETTSLYNVLDAAERERAARYKMDIHRARFIAARGTLRSLLGDYLSVPPQDVALCILPGGKPALEAEKNHRGIHFNISHCGRVALFAFADCEVGVDVQLVKHTPDLPRVVAHFFAPGERAAYETMCEDEQLAFFFRAWVRKEAYLKATGEGFTTGLSTIDIAEAQNNAIKRTDADGTQHIDSAYLIQDIAGIAHHSAAVAAKSASPISIRLNAWQVVAGIHAV
jgi:4'-phosphopantetheinyl transferase